MKHLSEYEKPIRPVKVLQFGEGGFLRGFADWMLQKLNDSGAFCGSVAVVQPIEKGMCDLLSEQRCLYTHLIRGAEGAEKTMIDVIDHCVKPYDDFNTYLKEGENPLLRFVISNTTEAGIVFSDKDRFEDAPPKTFPAKLTRLLYHRYEKGLGGLVFLPCELIDRNGDQLKKCLLQYAALWELGSSFVQWLENENVFCNTLVDRINTGYPRGEADLIPYEDKLLNASEYFHLWVIETDHDLESELPFSKVGLNVVITPDALERYRTRKVRLLNGAHTSIVAYGLLSGLETVKECTEDETLSRFLSTVLYDEIIPTLSLPCEELKEYADNVLLRFSNPHIRHLLADISLNSISKFKVRVLPSVLEYRRRFGTYPKNLMFALSCLLRFYREGTPRDDAAVIEWIRTHSDEEILANCDFWGEDISDWKEALSYANSSER